MLNFRGNLCTEAGTQDTGKHGIAEKAESEKPVKAGHQGLRLQAKAPGAFVGSLLLSLVSILALKAVLIGSGHTLAIE